MTLNTAITVNDQLLQGHVKNVLLPQFSFLVQLVDTDNHTHSYQQKIHTEVIISR